MFFIRKSPLGDAGGRFFIGKSLLGGSCGRFFIVSLEICIGELFRIRLFHGADF